MVTSRAKDLQPLGDDKKLGPEVQKENTLRDIESLVKQYEGDNPPLQKTEVDADSARQAVQNAVESTYNADRPEPLKSLNAKELTFDDEEGAPPVPPPIMPPNPA